MRPSNDFLVLPYLTEVPAHPLLVSGDGKTVMQDLKVPSTDTVKAKLMGKSSTGPQTPQNCKW